MNNHKTFYRFSIITLLQANKTKVFFNKLFVNNINNMSCNNIDSVAKKTSKSTDKYHANIYI